ncbi:MAG: hypothetical protein HYV96_05475 [Opitutae bacterium]|nr:hypothetical protein [Opitutae bacterium]
MNQPAFAIENVIACDRHPLLQGSIASARQAEASMRTLPLKTRARGVTQRVKNFFHAIRLVARRDVFPLKIAFAAETRRTAPHRISAKFLSTKKCRDFAGEKIDGVCPTTISSAPGSGQPHPVVVSNV